MNVLETLKIKDATLLELKDSDILCITVDEEATNAYANELADSIKKLFKSRDIKAGVMIVSNIKDIKIIRR